MMCVPPFFHVTLMTLLGLPSVTLHVSVTDLPCIGIFESFRVTLVLGGSEIETTADISKVISQVIVTEHPSVGFPQLVCVTLLISGSETVPI